MAGTLHYPDIDPPAGWSHFQMGPQVRLIPPGTDAQSSPVTIIVSPLLARHDRLPPPDVLIMQALEEEVRIRFELTAKTGPTPVQATSGLAGISLEVTGYARPRAPIEKRIYVMYSDALCYYGVSYLASEAAYDRYLEAFWQVARSVRPFHGRVVTPGTPAAPAT